MNRRTKWLAILVTLQVLFLLGLAGTSYAAVLLGQPVKLRTVPVDPRDMLYGDYVTLQYEASRVSPSLWRGGDPEPERGTAVYTVLAPDGEFFKPAAIYPAKPDTQDGEVVMKGIVEYSSAEQIVIRYGIERYFVPEGTGLDLERLSDRLAVTVRIAPWGQNVIEAVETRP